MEGVGYLGAGVGDVDDIGTVLSEEVEAPPCPLCSGYGVLLRTLAYSCVLLRTLGYAWS